MRSNETSLLVNRKFKVHAQEFQFQGSALLAKNEQRIYITDKGTERQLQLVVQLVEAHASQGGQRPIDERGDAFLHLRHEGADLCRTG